MRDTTTKSSPKPKRPRNQPTESENEKGSKRARRRHGNGGDESDSDSPNDNGDPEEVAPVVAQANEEENPQQQLLLQQLSKQMKQMKSMFRSELFQLREQLRQQNTDHLLASQRLTSKLNTLQQRVDQLLQQRPQQQQQQQPTVNENDAADTVVRNIPTTPTPTPAATVTATPVSTTAATTVGRTRDNNTPIARYLASIHATGTRITKTAALSLAAAQKKATATPNATTVGAAAAAARTKTSTVTAPATTTTATRKSVPTPATAVPPPMTPETDTREAVLIEAPKDLFALWEEYDKGINGAKPAKLFTPAERGAPKLKRTYYRRRVFWETVSMMIQPQRGWSVLSAIDAIYKEYGDGRGRLCTVTKILHAMLQRRSAKKLELFGEEGKGKTNKGMEETSAAEYAIATAAIPPSMATAAAAGTGTAETSPTTHLTPVNDTRPATLSERPKTLFLLWEEYQIGINGSKPAKLFTVNDRRGKVKQTYSRRKVFWDAVSKMLQEKVGWTAKDAIEAIYQEYGGGNRKLSTTAILQAMIRKRGESRKDEEEKSTS